MEKNRVNMKKIIKYFWLGIFLIVYGIGFFIEGGLSALIGSPNEWECRWFGIKTLISGQLATLISYSVLPILFLGIILLSFWIYFKVNKGKMRHK